MYFFCTRVSTCFPTSLLTAKKNRGHQIFTAKVATSKRTLLVLFFTFFISISLLLLRQFILSHSNEEWRYNFKLSSKNSLFGRNGKRSKEEKEEKVAWKKRGHQSNLKSRVNRTLSLWSERSEHTHTHTLNGCYAQPGLVCLFVCFHVCLPARLPLKKQIERAARQKANLFNSGTELNWKTWTGQSEIKWEWCRWEWWKKWVKRSSLKLEKASESLELCLLSSLVNSPTELGWTELNRSTFTTL